MLASAEMLLPLAPGPLRDMGGAPRNPAPRNHFLVWIVKSPGCH